MTDKKLKIIEPIDGGIRTVDECLEDAKKDDLQMLLTIGLNIDGKMCVRSSALTNMECTWLLHQAFKEF